MSRWGGSDPSDMPIDRLGSVALTRPLEGLGEAVDRQAEALADVSEAVAPAPEATRLELSAEALAALDAAPSAEDATAEAIAAGHGVEAQSAVARAEDDRFAALVFLLAHHGPPLE